MDNREYFFVVGILLLLFVFSMLQAREYRQLAMDARQLAIEAQTGWRECLANSGVAIPTGK